MFETVEVLQQIRPSVHGGLEGHMRARDLLRK
jgi:hypothetical protein